MSQKNCRIDEEIYKKLKEHKEKSGVPIAVAIEQAVKQWLNEKGGKAE